MPALAGRPAAATSSYSPGGLWWRGRSVGGGLERDTAPTSMAASARGTRRCSVPGRISLAAGFRRRWFLFAFGFSGCGLLFSCSRWCCWCPGQADGVTNDADMQSICKQPPSRLSYRESRAFSTVPVSHLLQYKRSWMLDAGIQLASPMRVVVVRHPHPQAPTATARSTSHAHLPAMECSSFYSSADKPIKSC